MQEKLRKNSFCTFDERRPRGIFEWIDDYQKNKPQTNALVAGVMLMVCGGQSIGWGIFNNHLQAQSWAGGYEDEFTVFWAIICWFIAGIAGFVISTVVVNKYSKISIYVSSLEVSRKLHLILPTRFRFVVQFCQRLVVHY